MNAALSKGNSYRFMLMNLATAFCQGILIFVAVRPLASSARLSPSVRRNF